MRIKVNGARVETAAATLAALLEERGVAADGVATALDGAFVARADRAATPLEPGAAVEILAPMQGG